MLKWQFQDHDRSKKCECYGSYLLTLIVLIYTLGSFYFLSVQGWTLQNDLKSFPNCIHCLNKTLTETEDHRIFLPTCEDEIASFNNVTNTTTYFSEKLFEDGRMGASATLTYHVAVCLLGVCLFIALGVLQICGCWECTKTRISNDLTTVHPIFLFLWSYFVLSMMFPILLEVNLIEFRSYDGIDCPSLTLTYEQKNANMAFVSVMFWIFISLIIIAFLWALCTEGDPSEGVCCWIGCLIICTSLGLNIYYVVLASMMNTQLVKIFMIFMIVHLILIVVIPCTALIMVELASNKKPTSV